MPVQRLTIEEAENIIAHLIEEGTCLVVAIPLAALAETKKRVELRARQTSEHCILSTVDLDEDEGDDLTAVG